MVKKCGNDISRIVLFCIAIILLVTPAMAASTQVHVVKLANDGITILNETTTTYQWMQSNLPIYGDETTHWYLQGPVFSGDRWNPAEDSNLKDWGTNKGTNVKDLCDLVGGMNSGETIKIWDGGFSKTFPYENVYSPDPRQGPMIISWWSNGAYVPSFADGMRLLFLADTSNNPGGLHCYGIWDMNQTLPVKYQYFYYDGGYQDPFFPTTTGLSVKYINEIIIYSNQAPPVAPVAAFASDIQTGVAPLTVKFTDQSTGTPPFTYAWDFNGDGEIDSTVQNPEIIFLDEGTYPVNLTVTNKAGISSLVIPNFITVYPAPVAPIAAFTSDVQTGTAPLTVQFTDQSTGTGPFTYAWDFDNDGSTDSTLPNPSYTFTTDGVYSVKLSVTGPGGSDDETKISYITISPAPVTPIAAFTSDVQTGAAPLTVQFTDQSTGTGPFTYAWDFDNDGSTDSTLPTPSYTFTTDGVYTVKLSVTGPGGSDDETKISYITVSPAPVTPTAAFTSDVQTGAAPLTVQFTDQSTGTGPFTYAWDFNNDGTTDSTLQGPSYTYTIAGTYTVNLTVTDSVGSDAEVKAGYISVTATPVVDTLFDGTVTLAPDTKFTLVPYTNLSASYQVNTTTPLGALNSVNTSTGISVDVSNKKFGDSGILMVDNIGKYLYSKSAGTTWICQVNGVTLDDYGYPSTDGLNIKSLADGDQVNFYYGTKPVTPANAVAVVRIKVNITSPGPVVDTLFDGTVTLAPDTKFTLVPYTNLSTSYQVSTTTPLGALNSVNTSTGISVDVSNKKFGDSGILMVDNIGKYLYSKSAGTTWICQVNGVTLDDYGYPSTDGLNIKSLADGDQVNFYYGTKPVTPANAVAVVRIKVNTGNEPTIPEWTLSLKGAKTTSVTQKFFEEGLACSSSGHQEFWTDTDGNVWGGVPLWLLVAMVDDSPDVGSDHYNFNDNIAAQGYSVKVISGDGWDTTLASGDIARNDNYIVANTLNGQPLPANLTSGKLSWPLHLKGEAVFGGQQVGNITSIELTGLPEPGTGWTLTLEGDVTDVITQSYFEDAIACHHNVTWTDESGTVWEGVSLWDLAGAVDDIETTSHYTFNDARAATGYTIRVSAGDGFNATFASADVAHNDGYFIAHRMNGLPLTGSSAPLKLVGPSTTSNKQRIGNVVKISLEGLPDQYLPGDWQLTMTGKISDVIPQGEFEYFAGCHSATYTDDLGNVYTGIPLWRLMGWVDDLIPHGSNGFNDAAAVAGYKVIVKAGDGYSKEFTSQQIGKNDNYIVANTMNGAPLPTDGNHPPYPLRLVGSSATGGNSVGNIVEIQLTDFQAPVEAPKLHIVKYGSDGITVINETTIDYHYMEDNLPIIGDGVTHYMYQGVTFDPVDLWDPTETKGMSPPKIDNAIKGTKVKDLVELVGGMGTGTDILFVSSDGYETHMGYSNIYTNPYVQSHQGDAVLVWYADGKYVPQYADGMRFMFTPEDHVFGHWDMHEALDSRFWHYYWSDGIQYPSAAGTSAKYVTEIKIYSSPETDWQMELDGSQIGGISTSISKTYLEQALACQFGANHKASYTDSKGRVWEGMPLWFFAGFVDDADQHSDNAFNNTLAQNGYRIVVTGSDGFSTEIDSRMIIRNSNYLVANSLDGIHIAESDENWPLRLTGANVSGSMTVKGVTSIKLLPALNEPVAAFSADPITGTAPLLVQFTDLSTGTAPLTYAWDFNNDGITDDTTQNPSYTYTTAGIYTVNLTVTDTAGSSSELKTDYITVDPATVIDEWTITLTGVGSEQLTRADFEALAADNRLSFTDASGTWSGVALWRIIAHVDDSDPTTFSDSAADLGYTVTVSASDGYSKTFTSSSLKRNDNFIVADSLNGAPLPKLDGTKKVWPLKIVGSAPTSGQKVGNITQIALSDFVTPPPPVTLVAGFSSDVQTGSLTVQFTDESTGTGPFTYAWDFGDGSSSSDPSPSHTFATEGMYSVKLTVTNSAGSDDEIQSITVNTAPVIPTPEFPTLAFPIMIIGAMVFVAYVYRREE